jgi:integrase
MSINQRPQSGTNLLQTALAKPYHYRRSGRYYLRLRPQGATKGFFTLSLRTTDKATAMTLSKDIIKTLAVFHLDQPEATWEDLKEALKVITDEALSMSHSDETRSLYMEVYDQMCNHLAEAASVKGFNKDQHRAVSMGQRVLRAAQERLDGRPAELLGLVEELSCSTPVPLSPSLSVLPIQPLTFKALSALYMDEHKEHAGANTIRDVKSSCKTIAEILGDLDLKTHTREDMKNLRAKLLEGRKPLTVAKILTTLSTVMKWAVNNDYLTKALTEGLKPTKGTDSSREAFSQDQVKTLMAHAKTLPVDSWQRWALSLGVIAGTRIEELRQLTKADVKQVAGVWVIDINRNDGKTAKTKNALRVVPLTDGAYGFDLPAFLQFVEKADSRLFTLGAGQFSVLINGALRDVLSLKADRTQTFHSLRHSLAGALKAVATQVEINEAILGHASGSISNDLYGAGSSVEIGRMAEALKTALL